MHHGVTSVSSWLADCTRDKDASNVATVLCCSCLAHVEYQPKLAAHGPVEPGATSTHPFPDTENYQTLVLDLHTHMFFQTAMFGPTIRVSEALRDGLNGQLPSIWSPAAFVGHPHPDRNRA